MKESTLTIGLFFFGLFLIGFSQPISTITGILICTIGTAKLFKTIKNV